MSCLLQPAFLALLVLVASQTLQTQESSYQSASSAEKETDCGICRKVVDNFIKGLEATKDQTYDTGSLQWEKNHLVSYNKSEIRLVTIMDDLCANIKLSSKCYSLVEAHEAELERWFSTLQHEDVPLFEHFCVDTAKECCQPGHYGKDCQACQGLADGKMCSGHGTCLGDGTRRGSGLCKCSLGYAGALCKDCKESFYVDNSTGDCIPCHHSCDGSCVNHTMEGCLGGCKEGWERDEAGTCRDLDECSAGNHTCKEGQYCLNVPGKYYCRDCHKYCLTCNGENANNCLTCRQGHEKSKKNECVDVNECQTGTHGCKPMTYCVNKVGSHKCKKCSSGCASSCTGPGLEACLDCAKGYEPREGGVGCKDIDECSLASTTCPNGRYCKNTRGSHKCKKCDEACSLCHGPGPYSCLSCTDGYRMADGVCKDAAKLSLSESSEEEGENEDL